MPKSLHRRRLVLGATAAALLAAPAAHAAAPSVNYVGFYPQNPRTTTPVDFYLSGVDADGAGPLSYGWDFSGGSAFAHAADTIRGHTFSADAVHSIAWQIKDAGSETTSGRFIMGTHPDNWAPRVDLAGDAEAVTGRRTHVGPYVVDDSPDSGWTYAFEADGDGDFDDGEPVFYSGDTTPDPTSRWFTFATDGAHTVKVRVSDGQGQTTEKAATITTHTANRAPLVHLGDEHYGAVGEPVGVYAYAGDDYTDRDALTYEWYLGGVKVEDADSFYLSLPPFDTTGEHTLKLVVSEPGDGGLKTEVTSVLKIVDKIDEGAAEVYVSKAGQFDHATAPTFATLENAGLGVYLPGAADGTTYEWDLDADGAFDDADQYSTTFSAPNKGSYKVAVRATSPGRAPVTVQRTVVVDSGPDYKPGAPVVVPNTPGNPTPPVVQQLPVGKQLAVLGPVLLSDGNVPGGKPGVTRQGINLKAGTLFFGSVFSQKPAQVVASYTVALTKAGRVKASAAAKKKAKVLKLGRSVVNLPGNASAPLKVKLSSKAKKALKKVKSVKVTAKFAVKDLATGKTTSAVRTIKLKVVKK